jgi:cholesterol transport system auxiliary component
MAGASGKRFLAALALLLVSACAPLSPRQAQIEKHMLDQLPAGLPQASMRAASLLLLPSGTEAAYDTTQIAYTEMPHRIAYFSRHEWVATPSQMLQPLLQRMLERAHYFRAVLTPPYAFHYGYALQAGILELVQDFSADPPLVRIALHAQLLDGASNRVLATREIAAQVSLRERTPDAGVEAANQAVAQALRQLAGFLLESTK